MNYKLSPIKITPPQKEWLNNEQRRTGNSIAAVVRNLIQEKIEESSDDSKSGS